MASPYAGGMGQGGAFDQTGVVPEMPAGDTGWTSARHGCQVRSETYRSFSRIVSDFLPTDNRQISPVATVSRSPQLPGPAGRLELSTAGVISESLSGATSCRPGRAGSASSPGLPVDQGRAGAWVPEAS